MPLPLKRALKVGARPVDRAYLALRMERASEPSPVPPLRLRSRIGTGWSVGYYLDSGRRVAEAIEAALGQMSFQLGEGSAVLDFGCGCGRVVSHLLGKHPNTRFYGCDVDAEAIRWASLHIPDVDFRVNDQDPPLPYPRASFDFVYSVSILTHVSESAQRRWLEELSRVLQPGGLALVTTCGPTMLDQMKGTKAASNSRGFTRRVLSIESIESEGDIVFVPYLRSRSNRADFPGVGDEYGLALQTEAYTRREWSLWFEVEVLPGVINEGQDAVLLRRRVNEY
jgi:SAM-dependent methyltransferase